MISDAVHIYSPLTAELTAHLSAISRDNGRTENPTHWSVQLFAGPTTSRKCRVNPPAESLRFRAEIPQNISYIETAIKAGQHVLPISRGSSIRSFPRLKQH